MRPALDVLGGAVAFLVAFVAVGACLLMLAGCSSPVRCKAGTYPVTRHHDVLIPVVVGKVIMLLPENQPYTVCVTD